MEKHNQGSDVKLNEDASTTVYKHTWWKIALIVGFIPALAIAGISSSLFQKWGKQDPCALKKKKLCLKTGDCII